MMKEIKLTIFRKVDCVPTVLVAGKLGRTIYHCTNLGSRRNKDLQNVVVE